MEKEIIMQFLEVNNFLSLGDNVNAERVVDIYLKHYSKPTPTEKEFLNAAEVEANKRWADFEDNDTPELMVRKAREVNRELFDDAAKWAFNYLKK